jgi:hypothetical protein
MSWTPESQFRARGTAPLAVLAVVTALAGCGSDARVPADQNRGGQGQAGHPQVGPRLLTVGQGRLGHRAPASLLRSALPPVGAAERVNAGGASLTVTVREVIDPLRGSGAKLPGGDRAVGVIVQIRSRGPRVYDSSATGDIALVASSGPVTPVLATRGICRTQRNDFDRYITAGEDRVGCVVFAVADGATLDAVRFSPHARRQGSLSWAP